jgi:hypothetical protein
MREKIINNKNLKTKKTFALLPPMKRPILEDCSLICTIISKFQAETNLKSYKILFPDVV